MKDQVELSIALIGSGRMRKLNQRYRGKNRVTDVLSFPESKVFFDQFKIRSWQEVKGLGEIVICPREVKKSAKRLDSTFEKELATVLIHGILHLVGYNDKNEEGAKKMAEKQGEHLAKITNVSV